MRASILVLTVLGTVAIAHADSTSDCNELTPAFTSDTLPLGCPATAYVHPETLPRLGPIELALSAARGPGPLVRLTTTVQAGKQELDVDLTPGTCGAQETDELVDYDVFMFDISDAKLGDVLVLGDVTGPVITAAGPCPLIVAPAFFCNTTASCPPPPDPDPDQDPGCESAGRGNAGLAWLGIALGAIVSRRRRHAS